MRYPRRVKCRPSIALVTPAVAAANNGNWQTTQRWARFLAADYRVRVTTHWEGGDEALMIALHARRSAASVAAWRAQHPRRALLLVLTGTDLYGDVPDDEDTRRSMASADRLLVLNELGLRRLPAAQRAKGRVCLQSAPSRPTLPKTARRLRVLAVGHLRDVKSPQAVFAAAQRLAHRSDIVFDHIGAGLDADLAARAATLTGALPHYRWLGALPHAATRERIRRAHLLLHPSRIEGGAHVIIEAVTSGTPVLASRIDGNVGLLGADYGGYFEPGDDAGLATLIAHARDDPVLLKRLRAQCARRAPLFHPEAERSRLLDLLAELRSDESHGRP